MSTSKIRLGLTWKQAELEVKRLKKLNAKLHAHRDSIGAFVEDGGVWEDRATAAEAEVKRLTKRCEEARELFDGLYPEETMGISIPLILGKRILKWREGKP